MIRRRELDDIAASFNEIVNEKLRQKLGDAVREGAEGTTGQALEIFQQYASGVQKLKMCCQNVDWDIISVIVELKMRNVDDDISKSFDEAANKELRQKLGDAVREGAEGTIGQALEAFQQFASKFQKLKEDCDKVDKERDRISNYKYSIGITLSACMMHDLTGPFYESFDEELQQKVGDALRERVQQGTIGQAFETLQQFASKAYQLEKDCSTINQIMHQLRPSSNAAERANLQQQFRNALVEALQGSNERPAFRVLERKLNKNMLEQFHSCKSKIANMQSIYQHFIDFKPDQSKTVVMQSIYQRFIDSKTDFQGSPIALRRMNNDDKSRYNAIIEILKELSNKFEEQRENAQQKSDSDRVEDARLLMRTLSEIEDYTQSVEELSEQLIDHRFEESQAAVTKPNDWFDLHPNEPLVKDYKAASTLFTEAKEEIRKMSGGARAKGNLLLAEMLYNIESLEDKMNWKKQKREWIKKMQKALEGLNDDWS